MWKICVWFTIYICECRVVYRTPYLKAIAAFYLVLEANLIIILEYFKLLWRQAILAKGLVKHLLLIII